jgi:hypothetical protein
MNGRADMPELKEMAQEKSGSLYQSYTVYANESAICFNACKTKDGTNSIMVDASKKRDEFVDWKNKTSLQLTQRELTEFYSVLKRFELKYELPKHNAKSMSARWQKDGIFLTVFTKGFTAAVPVKGGDIFVLTALVMRQLKLNYPYLAAFEIERMIGDNAKAIRESNLDGAG